MRHAGNERNCSGCSSFCSTRTAIFSKSWRVCSSSPLKIASFHVVAMDAIFSRDAEQTRQLLEKIAVLVEQNALHPLQFRSFPACRIDVAFRWMAQGKHTGKVIVSFPEPFVARRGEPLAPAFEVKPDGCYLITGA